MAVWPILGRVAVAGLGLIGGGKKKLIKALESDLQDLKKQIDEKYNELENRVVILEHEQNKESNKET